MPGNIVFVPVNRAAGTGEGADGPLEAYIAGTQPGGASASLAVQH